MKRTCILAALLGLGLLSALPACAAQTPEAEFLGKLVESLSYQQSACQRNRSLTPPELETPNPAAISAFLGSLAKTQADLKESKKIVNPYLSAQDQTIAKVAGYVLSIYEKQIRLGERSLKLYRQVYDPEYMNDLDDFTAGKLLDEVHKLPQMRETADKFLMDAGVVITHVLYSQRLDKEGKMSYLTITASERKLLSARLDELLAGSASREDNYADACLSDIRGVLASRYKSADE